MPGCRGRLTSPTRDPGGVTSCTWNTLRLRRCEWTSARTSGPQCRLPQGARPIAAIRGLALARARLPARLRSSGARCMSAQAQAELELGAEQDRYGGLRVLRQHLPPAQDKSFSERLDHSLALWKERGVRGVWLEIPVSRSELVPAAVERGFAPHHADAEHFMLSKWLPDFEPCTFPPPASHQVGVGAVVASGEHALMVKENRGPTGVWKIPTGILEQGEDIVDGALREVQEETGLHTTFEACIAIRQAHRIAFGKSDMFFLCVLRLANEHESTPHVTGKGELETAAWDTVDRWEEELSQRFPPGSLWHELHCRAFDYILNKNSQTALGHATLPLKIREGSNLVFYSQSDRDANNNDS